MTDRNQEIIRLVEAGKTYAEVAYILGLTRSVVAGVVWRKSSKSRVVRRRKRHVFVGSKCYSSVAEAAAKTQNSESIIYRWIRDGRCNARWVE